jgi:hypothetical protein
VAGVEARAIKIGVGADRVLIDAGVMSEEDYIRALAQWLRLPFEALEHLPRTLCPLSDAALLTAARTPILPVELGDGPARIVAPRGMAVRLLVKAARAHQSLPFVRLAAPAALNRFITRFGAVALGQAATSGLDARYPMISSAPRPTPRVIWMAPLLGLVALTTALWPGVLLNVLALVLTALFIGWTVLRLRCLFAPVDPMKREASRLTDKELPLYTVIVALYREAPSVRGLVSALKALDYPPEKIDVKFVIEGDDGETRAALEALALGPRFEIIIAPDIGPRTKPKALNVALTFARRSDRNLRRGGSAGAGSTTPCRCNVRGSGGRSCLCSGGTHHRQYPRQLARSVVYRGVCRPLRRAAAGPCRERLADPAWRNLEPFPYR